MSNKFKIPFQGKQSSKFKVNNGFTLIELLVVIAIIGVLSTLLLANFNSARSRARDAQRKSDVNQIQKALELYKDDTSAPLTYPGSLSWNSALSSGGNTYMQKLPCDPLATVTAGVCSETYTYESPHPSTPADTLTYRIYVCLENLADKDSDVSKGASDLCPAADRTSYTRTQP